MKLSIGQLRRLRRGGRHTGKVRYGKLEAAKRACEEMAAKGKGGLTPYLCGLCQGYHIGHEPNLFGLPTITVAKKKA